MIKSGKIKQLVKEKKDLLFNKLYDILVLILQNFDYFDELNVALLFDELNKVIIENCRFKTLDKDFVLKLINSDFQLKSSKSQEDISKEYISIISSYLTHATLIKVFLADIYNYFTYLQVSQENDLQLKLVAFCSIYIKFRYFILKKYSYSGLTQKDNELAKRILENTKQFGGMANDRPFINAISNEINDVRSFDNMSVVGQNKFINSTMEANSKEQQGSNLI